MNVVINRTPKIYYISLTGSNSNDGLTTGTAWRTLTYAVSIASPVLPGDTIYIKGGNYGNENVVFQKSGLPGSPITIIGYKTTPGDSPAILTNSGTPYAAYSVTEMPTYTGSSRASGTAFDMENTQYIIMRNFQVTTYYRAFFLGFNTPENYGRISGHWFFNCNVMSLGDLGDGYSGFAFKAGSYVDTVSTHIRANGNIFNSCLIANPGAEGMLVCGDYNSLFDVKVYCNEGAANPLDYFINIAGSYNVVSKCYVEGTTGNFGGTHGIGCKSNSEETVDKGRTMPQVNPMYNNFYNCVSKYIGEGFYVRHRGAQHNTFTKCYSYGTHTGTASAGVGGCIVIRDGASYNTFDSCRGENLASAILFQDTTEDGGASGGNNYNVITNCAFYNTYGGILFDDYDVPGDTGINTVSHCTFLYSRYIHICQRNSTQMIYKNNIYYGNDSLGYGGYFRGGTGSFANDVVVGQFSNCVFYNIPSMPGGFVGTNSNIGTDPLFVSLGNIITPTAPDMHLQSGSPAKDAGVSLDYIKQDFDGIVRPIGSAPSIGAYER